MTSTTAIVVAIIAALPPTFAVLWSHRKLHYVVNSRYEDAIATIKRLEAEIRSLKGER